MSTIKVHDDDIEFEMDEVQIEIENHMKEKDQMFIEEEVIEDVSPIDDLMNDLKMMKKLKKYSKIAGFMMEMFNRSIEDDNRMKMDEFKDKDLDPSYLAGFMDGDGYYVMTESNGYVRYGLYIGQCRTNILQIIHYHFYGQVRQPDTFVRMNQDENLFYCKDNIREIYSIKINSYYSKYMVKYMEPYVIFKKNQIQCILEAIDIKGEYKKEKLIDLKNKCQEYNQRLTDVEYDFSKMNDAYIAGLYDAEGCITIGHRGVNEYSCKVGIAQKNHPIVLTKLVEYFGYGTVDRYTYVICGKNHIRNFLERMMPYLIVKKNQSMTVYEFLCIHKEINTPSNAKILFDACIRILNKEKHMGESIDLPNELPHDKFLDKVDTKFVKMNDDGTRSLLGTYEIKSMMMKGDANHNYGKEFSDITKQKMCMSMSMKKREGNKALSDENIDLIRQMRKDKLTQQEIIDQFEKEGISLHRDTIRLITNGSIKTIHEMNIDLQEGKKTAKPMKNTKGLSHEEKTSIGKRNVDGALNFSERLEIMMMKRDLFNKKSERYLKLDAYAKSLTPVGSRKKQVGIPLISTYLTREFSKNVSEHIIKNMWDGRGVLFEAEFNSESVITYEEYRGIIDMKFK